MAASCDGLQAASSACRCATCIRRRFLLTGLLASILVALASAASASAASDQAVRLWSQAIKHTAVPRAGCFHASYPALTWQKVRCGRLPHPRDHENPPHGASAQFGPLPQVGSEVGGGHGGVFSAKVPTGTITSAVGSIPSVSAGATEEDGGTAEKFSLQMNSNTFSGPPECGTISGCEGWEQFIYSSSLNEVFIEFWLLNHQKPKEGNKCPKGWSWLGPAKKEEEEYLEADCNLKSELTTLPGGPLKVSGLTGATLEGRANIGGLDSVVLVTAGGSAVASGAPNLLDLYKGWQVTEFAVLGDFNGTKANFSSNTTLTVKTGVRPSTLSDAAPECVNTSFTAESNNLTAEGTPALLAQPLPTVASQQTNGTASAASCATYGISPPSVAITTPPEGAQYNYGQVVDAEYSCTAAEGATLKSCNGTVPDGSPINTTSGTSNSFTVTAEDTDGQKETVTHGYEVVAAPPKASISAPAEGGIYRVGEVVPTTFSCTEGPLGPGLESCDDSNGTNTVSGGSGTLATTALGPHTYTVTAKSKDGQSKTTSIAYTVAAAPTADIESPAGGGTYKEGEIIPTAFSCKEGAFGLGLESCVDSNGASGGVGALNTSGLGSLAYEVTAKSKDGQTGTASIGYTVITACNSARGWGRVGSTGPEGLDFFDELSKTPGAKQQFHTDVQLPVGGRKYVALTTFTSPACLVIPGGLEYRGQGAATVAGVSGYSVAFSIARAGTHITLSLELYKGATLIYTETNETAVPGSFEELT